MLRNADNQTPRYCVCCDYLFGFYLVFRQSAILTTVGSVYSEDWRGAPSMQRPGPPNPALKQQPIYHLRCYQWGAASFPTTWGVRFEVMRSGGSLTLAFQVSGSKVLWDQSGVGERGSPSRRPKPSQEPWVHPWQLKQGVLIIKADFSPATVIITLTGVASDPG